MNQTGSFRATMNWDVALLRMNQSVDWRIHSGSHRPMCKRNPRNPHHDGGLCIWNVLCKQCNASFLCVCFVSTKILLSPWKSTSTTRTAESDF
jgi:hypothetical protein